ncbi:MAG: cell wall-binding repeat-containing protein, partial [Lachnospiraceae bacterium]|nr:cell wall-binding repeat-containing protein [Candidatus Equihabitans merdae]
NLMILEAAGCDEYNTLLIASGSTAADSLSASSTGQPILMVGEELTAEQKTWLKDNKFSQYVILGGNAAVSASVQKAIADISGTEVKRLAGSNRFETSTKIAAEFFECVDDVTFAYGWDFPDGLSGGPVANACGAPVILITDSADECSFAKNYLNKWELGHAYIMGGTARISDKTVTGMIDYLDIA